MNASPPPFGVVGTTIKTYTGIYYDLKNPRACDVCIEDIAHALSMICRFGGHIPHRYSVAEHSINCYLKAKAEGCTPHTQIATLLHDAAEAYVGDVVKPLKILIGPLYDAIEEANERAIESRFCIDLKGTKSTWKRIDKQMLIAERDAIFGKDGMQWPGEAECEPHTITPYYYSPQEAEHVFLQCFHDTY